jgi:hypothetical protein
VTEGVGDERREQNSRIRDGLADVTHGQQVVPAEDRVAESRQPEREGDSGFRDRPEVVDDVFYMEMSDLPVQDIRHRAKY